MLMQYKPLSLRSTHISFLEWWCHCFLSAIAQLKPLSVRILSSTGNIDYTIISPEKQIHIYKSFNTFFTVEKHHGVYICFPYLVQLIQFCSASIDQHPQTLSRMEIINPSAGNPMKKKKKKETPNKIEVYWLNSYTHKRGTWQEKHKKNKQMS